MDAAQFPTEVAGLDLQVALITPQRRDHDRVRSARALRDPQRPRPLGPDAEAQHGALNGQLLRVERHHVPERRDHPALPRRERQVGPRALVPPRLRAVGRVLQEPRLTLGRVVEHVGVAHEAVGALLVLVRGFVVVQVPRVGGNDLRILVDAHERVPVVPRQVAGREAPLGAGGHGRPQIQVEGAYLYPRHGRLAVAEAVGDLHVVAPGPHLQAQEVVQRLRAVLRGVLAVDPDHAAQRVEVLDA